MARIGTDIHEAAHLLRAGELVAIPTETVYGLAGNGLDPEAVLRIFKVKNRPSFDPLILHAASLERMRDLVLDIPAPGRRLAEAFWPGPLTLLLDKSPRVPDLVTSGLSRVALRVPDHALSLALLRELDFPLAAPSANPFGYVSPTTAAHVADQLGAAIPYILDGGPCRVGIESTIVGFENGEAVVYRLGGKRLEEIEEIAGPLRLYLNQSSNPSAPGMIKSHYAPSRPLLVGDVDELLGRHAGKRIGVLSFHSVYPAQAAALQIRLSDKASLEEAAAGLFAALRRLDQAPIDIILAEKFPEQGLGRAINDRLRRAAAR